MSNRNLAIAVLVAAVAFALSPVIFPGFAGYDGDLFPVPQNDPPIQPAGWAFAIWGPIYLWLIVGAGYGAWRRSGDEDWRPMRAPLLASLGVGFLWIPVAQSLPGLATIMILLMWAGAVLAMIRAGRGDRWFQVRPVALYAGWLTAASGVSVGIWLAGHGILPGIPAAILCLAGVTAVTIAVQGLRPDAPLFAGSVIWALTGIAIANVERGNPALVVLAVVAGGLILWRAWRGRHQGTR
ncbi:tryptophan-rich sensory protein [Paracoccus sp. 1_MG-2023]|uniref:tryptophan-rich sensory protein n=1 Tax=unclassified Paracoccus (in: a-proteobacteria) TaxID=2688777 RepID=UPI001C092429|nr:MULTISPECIES: tryptophan-rich sensory protein [unclassified Paracoccus (in: a-proteobacteria)]MBU2956241.1 tryptophan-rich sensory protein [Paracoccus sp. C2R09]MDO6667918.1 tryptophan-rich sensory protein [Paracoccus sp. 1_MG-2023]